MKRQFSACQTSCSMYLSIFKSFQVIRCLSQCVSPKIAIFMYRSPHCCFPWRRPCDYHAICFMDEKTIQCLPSNVARSTLQGGNVTTHQTCAGSQRQSVTHSLPPLWFLVTSRTVSTDLQLFTLASNFPSSEESNAEDGTSGRLTGLAILSPQNVPFR